MCTRWMLMESIVSTKRSNTNFEYNGLKLNQTFRAHTRHQIPYRASKPVIFSSLA